MNKKITKSSEIAKKEIMAIKNIMEILEKLFICPECNGKAECISNNSLKFKCLKCYCEYEIGD